MVDREAGKAMPTDAMFRICSMTKPITSVAVMMLYEEGKFLLGRSGVEVPARVQESQGADEAAEGRAVHDSGDARRSRFAICCGIRPGLTYNWNEDLGPMYEKANVASGLLQYDGTIGDNVKRLAGLPLLFSPGDRLEYSLGVDVLGRLVEVVSGKPLDEFFRTRIFEPVGMKDTYFFPPENKVARLATAYTYYRGQRAESLSGYSDSRGIVCVLRGLSNSRTEETFFRRSWIGLYGDGLCAVLPDDAG